MSNNDQHIKKAAQKGYHQDDAENLQRIATKVDTLSELTKVTVEHVEDATAYAVQKRNELEREVARLKSDVRKANRRAENFKKKYNTTFNQWWQRCMEGWSRRGMVPPSVEAEIERIKREWEAQQIEP